MVEPITGKLSQTQIIETIGTLNSDQRKLFEIFGGRTRALSQRAVEDADVECPYCQSQQIMYDNDLRKDFNILIQECDDCGMEWCKEQSVKIPAILVRKIAISLRAEPSYTGVSEFVRAAVRQMCESVSNLPHVVAERNMEMLANAMMVAAQDDEEEYY